MVTLQTENEMIINADLDSTLIPSYTCQFLFLCGAYRDTKETLSIDFEGQHFI